MSNAGEKSLKAAYINLGCRVNRVEIDSIAEELERAGFETVSEQDADVVIVNTCAVTGEAESKTRKQIRHAAHLPQKPVVLATGCVANLYADDLNQLADNVLVETNKQEVANKIIEIFDVDISSSCTNTNDLGTVTPTGRTRPGVKIQDGCDNRCTYCIVWKARGKGISLDPDLVLQKVRAIEADGAQEVVLTGINLAAYDYDKDGKSYCLTDLLELLLKETSVKRFRLSSIEPPETDDSLLDCIAQSEGRIAPFLHLALQSGCDKTLKCMNRNYTTAEYAEVVRKAREKIPNLALGCDFIVGFPGETDEDFEESLAFCKKMGFEKMHVFRYSKRKGTPAATMPDQVDPKVMHERAARARELSLQMRKESAQRLVGTTQQVLIQKRGVGVTGGLFNCRVDILRPLNELISVKITSVKNDVLSSL